MFSILTDQAIQECSRLEKQVSELSGQIFEMEHAIRELRSLSDMDGPIMGLTRQVSEMEFQHTVLKQMMRAFNRTILDYMSCENRICDYGEQNVILYNRREVSINDLSDISDILMGIESR